MDSKRPPGARLARLRAALRHPFSSRRRKARRAALTDEPLYAAWIARYDTLGQRDRDEITARIARMEAPPRISVLMPVYDPPVAFLRAAIASVAAQLYPHWQLCIADDGSTDPAVRALLREYNDPRIRVVERSAQGGIAAASNSALELADGEWLALLDHDDCLAPHALYMVAAEIAAHPDAAMIFSDEDALDEEGRRCRPFFKPDWNPELMLCQNAFSHLGVFQAEAVRQLGGFHPGFDGSQDWDLALRVADAVGPERIRHIPHVLYHWRQAAPGPNGQFSQRHATRAAEAAERAVSEHLARNGRSARVIAHAGQSWKHIAWSLPSPPPAVSIVLTAAGPAGGRAAMAQRLVAATTYPGDVELLVPADAAAAGQAERVRTVATAGAENPSSFRNRAVETARGEIVVFLDGYLEPVAPDWLTELVRQASRPDVGAVGGLVIDRRGRIRHGGFLLSPTRIAVAAHRGWRARSSGYLGRAVLAQDLSAVSSAAMATRRSVFREAGGFDRELAWHFGDVDYCLRLRRGGQRVIWTPAASLREAGRSREAPAGALEAERALMLARWSAILASDPAGNPNLSSEDGDFRPAFPPRIPRPWLRAVDGK